MKIDQVTTQRYLSNELFTSYLSYVSDNEDKYYLIERNWNVFMSFYEWQRDKNWSPI